MLHKIRKLYLLICDDQLPPETHLVSLPLCYLNTHFPSEKLEIALRYLVKNQLTGTRFIQWYQDECKASNLEMHRKLMAAVEREKHTRILFAAKDLKHA